LKSMPPTLTNDGIVKVSRAAHQPGGEGAGMLPRNRAGENEYPADVPTTSTARPSLHGGAAERLKRVRKIGTKLVVSYAGAVACQSLRLYLPWA
jgi:hypothetical protein